MINRKIDIVPLTLKLWLQVDKDPPPYTVQGFAGVEDGKVLILGCVIRSGVETFLLFENTVDITLPIKRALIKGWRALKPFVKPDTIIVQNTELSTSDGFIKHFAGDLWRF